MSITHTTFVPVTVNRVPIAPAAIMAAASQYANEPEPETAAARALVMRELLRQRAAAIGLPVSSDGSDMIGDDAVIEQLLAREAGAPEPTLEECWRYYGAHPKAFRTGDLAEARHILFAVTPGAPINALRARAESLLGELLAQPEQFAARAAEASNCPSAQLGGNLGQLGPDDCVPEFASELFDDAHEGVLPRLVRTRFGFHIVQIERRIEGARLPFEAVQRQIAAMLVERVQLKAAQQYVRLLAGAAIIEGIEFAGAASSLVQ